MVNEAKSAAEQLYEAEQLMKPVFVDYSKLVIDKMVRELDTTLCEGIEMPELTPFSKNAQCPKCRCREVRIKYCRRGYLGRNTVCYLVHDEHLHRICECCRYEWVEACADA